MKNYTLLLIALISVLSVNLRCQNKAFPQTESQVSNVKEVKTKSKFFIGNYSVFVGLGTIAQSGYSYRYDNLYITARSYTNVNLAQILIGSIYGVFGGKNLSQDNSILIGYAFPTKPKFGLSGYGAFSSGISYCYLTRPGKKIGYEHYEKKETEGFGIPIDISSTVQLGIFAISSNITATYIFQQKEVIGGLFLNLHLGDFRNKYKTRKNKSDDSVPVISNKTEMEKLVNTASQIKGFTNNHKYSLELSVPMNPYRIQFAIHNYLKNYDLLIPMQYIKSNHRESYFYSDLNKVETYFDVSAQLRRWINKKNTYWLALGPKVLYVNTSEFGSEYFIFCSASIGFFRNIYKRLFLSSKLNLSVPLDNHIKYATIFGDEGINGSSYRISYDMINFGIMF